MRQIITDGIVQRSKQKDKQAQQGKAAFNERNSHTTQQHETAARSPGGPKTKIGQKIKDYISTSQVMKR
jgi:hypothetical protein